MSTEQERDALKPCPFCGSLDVRVQEHGDCGYSHSNWWEVNCFNVDCLMSAPTKHAAIEAWNHRAALSSPPPQGAQEPTIEDKQRERMNARFANRAKTPASADFDLPAPNDAIASAADSDALEAPFDQRACEAKLEAFEKWAIRTQTNPNEGSIWSAWKGAWDAATQRLIDEIGGNT